MGLRQFFGRSILKMVQEARDREAYDVERNSIGGMPTINDQVRNGMPTIVAYRISNGYIAQSYVGREYGDRNPAFHYCKDHQDIADFIVAEATRQALGVGSFPEVRAGSPKQTLAKASTAAQRTPY